MPQLVQQYSPRTMGEVVLFSMDYALNLQQGETINSSIWTCVLLSGTDSGVNRVSGGASTSGTVVSQLITFAAGTTSGNVYIISSTATTSLGQQLIGFSNVTVNAEN